MSNPFAHDKRRSMTPQRVARIYAFRMGRCGVWNGEAQNWGDGCGWKFGVKGDFEIDHITALARGGVDDDDLTNYQLLCCACHGKKTKEDVKEAASIKRAYTNHVVPSRWRKSRSWR